MPLALSLIHIRTKACRMLLAIFGIFQIWLCMTAVNDAWSGIVGNFFAMFATYVVSIAFIIALYKRGIIANILTDNGGMYVIYLLVAVLSGVSLSLIHIYSSGNGENQRCTNWQGMYEKNEDLLVLYNHLAALGYQVADEEWDWLLGQHECYTMPDGTTITEVGDE